MATTLTLEEAGQSVKDLLKKNGLWRRRVRMPEQLLLGKSNGSQVYIEPFHTLLAGQTNLSGKTSTIIALAGEAVKLGYTVLLFDTKPTMREFENFHDIPICYEATTDPLILIGLLEAKRRAKLNPLYATLARVSERAKDLKDVIENAELMEKTSKSGFIKDACYTLADLLRRLDQELSETKHAPYLNLEHETINVMAINKLSNEAQQLVLKTAFEQVLRNHNKKTIVVVDEAFRFFPQDYGSACKKAGQDLVTQGAKTKLFMWISTQFIAPTDKDPLKACPNKLFGRQDDSTEIEAIQKRIPGGRSLKSDQLMTLKRGEFWFVPLEGKPRKVLITPPWERALPKQVIADTEQIRGLVHELNETKHKLEVANKSLDTYRAMAADPAPPSQPEQVPLADGPITSQSPTIIRIDHGDTIVQLHHREPTLQPVTTTDTKGRILYVLVHDLKGGPATPETISKYAEEYGWTISKDAIRLQATGRGGLLEKGYLVRGEGKELQYRVPGKVKVEVIKD